MNLGAITTANTQKLSWWMSISGHWTDNSARKYFKVKFLKTSNGAEAASSGEIVHYMYSTNNRLEEFTLFGVVTLPKGTYKAEVWVDRNGGYRWHSAYGEVNLAVMNM